VGLLEPTPTPYGTLAGTKRPLAERALRAGEAWAMQGYGAPLGVFAVYAMKVVLYVAGWVAVCGLGPGSGPPWKPAA
jgi:hypothetical protein